MNPEVPSPHSDLRPDLPQGEVALLFTDIEGSTTLVRAWGRNYGVQLEAHRRILREAVTDFGGAEVDMYGDSSFAVFTSPRAALEAATQAQRELRAFSWPDGGVLRVRMGLHWGHPARTNEGYVGVDLHIGARLMEAGAGGQILVSRALFERVPVPPDGTLWRDWGRHRLRDLENEQSLFELCVDGATGFGAPRTLTTRPHNLPSSTSPILGRDAEIAAICSALRDGARLQTLLGPGGTGKTRLALAVAWAAHGWWPNGTFFVSLAPVITPDGGAIAATENAIAGAIMQTLGLHDEEGKGNEAALCEALHSRKMLLLLDNFEHLESGAALVSRLLSRCSGVQILVTSRVALQLSGERQLPISPLSLPPRALDEASALVAYAAVALFVERAKAAMPDFALTEENGVPIARICARLDGLPLALELAAARVRHLTPTLLLAKIESNLWFLKGSRDLPTRHQTLRSTIEWSHALLEERDKKVFRRLSVFRGSFSLEDAQAVCEIGEENPTGAPNEDDEIESAIESLLGQSLLVARSDSAEPLRFAMLETIREFALETLHSSGEFPQISARHAARALAFTLQADMEMAHNLPAALAQFEANLNNWRAAWNWALNSDPELALHLASSAALLWNRIGGIGENYDRLEKSLAAAPFATPENRCRALHYLVQAARNRCDWARCEIWIEQLEKLSHEINSTHYQAIALDQRRWDDMRNHDVERALKRGEQIIALRKVALQSAEEGGDIGEIVLQKTELRDAFLLQAEVLAHNQQFETALALVSQTLQFQSLQGPPSDRCFALYKYAQILGGSGQWARARPVFEQIVTLTRESGDRSIVLAWYCHEAALAALHENAAPRARQLLRESYEVWRQHAPHAAIPPTICALAWLQSLENQPVLAAQTFGAIARLPENSSQLESVPDSVEDNVRSLLGKEQWEAACLMGAARLPRELIETALQIPAL